MRFKYSFVAALAVCMLSGAVALAHFHTYWPDSRSGYATPGRRVNWRYFWGHPYEMILFDAREPLVYAVGPDGRRRQVELEPTTMRDPATGGERRSYRFGYTPQSIGDTWIVLEAPPYPIEEQDEAVRDYVKQCLHVMAEKGWSRRLELPIELVPLTRPYGIEAGFTFRARAYLDGEPLPDARVEIEKFNGFYVPEEDLPKDPFGNEDVPMITRVARTDKDGYVSYTLDEPGWWMVSVSAESGTVEVEGEEYPQVLRGGLWVAVEPEFTLEK